MELEKGVQRWIFDISSWNPSPHCFSFAMSFLRNHEYSSITRFVKSGDQKWALMSRSLQYALVHQVLEIPFDKIIIRRTPRENPNSENIMSDHAPVICPQCFDIRTSSEDETMTTPQG